MTTLQAALNDTQLEILRLVSMRTKDNPISRGLLTKYTNCRDRYVRHVIRQLREMGHSIVAVPSGGYYYGTTDHDKAVERDNYQKLLESISHTTSQLRRPIMEQQEVIG